MTRRRSTERSLFRFCPFCGTALARGGEHGDPAHPVCPACGFIQFRNPVVGVAAVIYEAETAALLGAEAVRLATGEPVDARGGRVLLARRAQTYRGSFCLPCGYVEFDEEIREALARETREETGLLVEPLEVVAVHSNFHDPDRQSVGIWFRARPRGGLLRAGDDVDALRFVPAHDPGVPLAFETDALVLSEIAHRRPG